MPDVYDNITAKNLEAQHQQLTEKVASKFEELSLIVADAKKELEVVRKEKELLILDSIKKQEAIKVSVDNFTQLEQGLKESVSTLLVQKDDISKAIKKATKELIHTNGQVLTAQQEYEQYQKLIADIQLLEEKLANLVPNHELLTSQVKLLDEERIRIMGDISTKYQESEGTLNVARNELSKLVYLAEEKKKEALEAESRTKAYTDQLYTSMNDYQIIRARLEDKWKQTFPELALPIE